jgi:hypothetical protein
LAVRREVAQPCAGALGAYDDLIPLEELDRLLDRRPPFVGSTREPKHFGEVETRQCVILQEVGPLGERHCLSRERLAARDLASGDEDPHAGGPPYDLREQVVGGDEVVWEVLERTIGTRPEGQDVAILVGALKSGDHRLRALAATALGDVGQSDVTEGLVAALGDSHRPVQVAAAESLAKRGDDRATPVLRAALEDHRRGVRYLAAAPLASGGPAARVTLDEYASRVGWRRRREIRRAVRYARKTESA